MARVVVGVTGHRWNKLRREDEAALRLRVRAVLESLGAGGVLYSMLAEGADRLAAEEALTLGWEIEAVLPFEQSRYERDFPSSTGEFRGLVSRCVSVKAAQAPGYLAGGIELLNASDCLIAIWDGNPASGPGGTGDIVARARAEGKRCVWIGAVAPHQVREVR